MMRDVISCNNTCAMETTCFAQPLLCACLLYGVVLLLLSSTSLDDLVTVDVSKMKVGQLKEPYLYTFDDPASYQGPVLIGWEPHVSRDVSAYVKPTEHNVISDLSCLDLSQTRILIMVMTNPGRSGMKQRASNRDTWAKWARDEYQDITVLNVMGTSVSSDLEALREEQETFCDILQFDYIDTYANITLDPLHALKFALGYKWHRKPEILVMADDDIYINIPFLYQELESNPLLNQTQELMLGDPHCGPLKVDQVIKDQGVDLKTSLKIPFFTIKYLLNVKMLPCSFNGGLYILPRATWECLFATAMTLDIHPNSDIFIGFLGEACGFERVTYAPIQLGYASFRGIADQDRYPRLGIHGVQMFQKQVLHQLVKGQKHDLSKPRAKGFHLQQNANGSIKPFYCNSSLNCHQVSLSLNSIARDNYYDPSEDYEEKEILYRNERCTCTNYFSEHD